jgi:hypothetical protein
MQRLFRTGRSCWPCLLLVFLAGCGTNNAVYPVRGKITFEGKPLPGGGSISFVPLDNQEGKTAGGEIAADGTYQLSTYSDGDGSMPGEFRVVIYQVTQQESQNTEDGQKPGRPTTSVSAADRIPEVYADPRKSTLRATVEPKSQEINFELKRS